MITSVNERDGVVTETEVVREPVEVLRTPVFVTRRRRWPGILVATVIGAAIAAVAVSSIYDQRTVGQRLDATVAATSAKVDEIKGDVKSTAQDAAADADHGTPTRTALGDAGITASVKTALAADPALSALKIDVTTQNGVVSLAGPAPDEKSRERAEVLAAAPQGVVRVDNQLVVSPS